MVGAWKASIIESLIPIVLAIFANNEAIFNECPPVWKKLAVRPIASSPIPRTSAHKASNRSSSELIGLEEAA